MRFEKTDNNNTDFELTPILKQRLKEYRSTRNFNVEEYIKTKSHIVNDYFNKSGLDTAIIALSGGIDSSIVLAMIDYASKQKNSPIKNVVPINMPVYDSDGVTNQKNTTELSEKLCSQLGYDLTIIDMSPVVNSIIYDTFWKAMPKSYINKDGSRKDTKWSTGQMVSYLRTSLLYYTTSLYTEKGYKPVIIGTTNRDEISYIGFFGKASDAMVDVQLISDLHKSEVYRVADYFMLPKKIIDTKPNGDMFHGKSDEEFFGFSYDFLELYTYFLTLNVNEKNTFLSSLNKEELHNFTKFSYNVEELHHYNSHKYPLRSSAIHFDIYDSKIEKNKELLVDKNRLIGLQKVFNFDNNGKTIITPEINKEMTETKTTNIKDKIIHEIKNFLTPTEVSWLNKENNSMDKVVANVHGYSNQPKDKSFGSLRASFYCEEIAENLYKRLSNLIPKFKIIKEDDVCDGYKKGEVWRHIGISPYFRLINYYHDNYLIPHYDAPFFYDDETTTLMSIVISLTTNESGDTIFIDDSNLKFNCESERMKYVDYNELFDELLEETSHYKIQHEAGSVTIFDHRILHQVPKIKSEHKLVIRTDLIFKRVY